MHDLSLVDLCSLKWSLEYLVRLGNNPPNAQVATCWRGLADIDQRTPWGVFYASLVIIIMVHIISPYRLFSTFIVICKNKTKVINADSAFAFLMILVIISQNSQCGRVGQVCQGDQGG